MSTEATRAWTVARALFIAGSKDWRRLAGRLGARHVLLVDAEGRLHMTPAMAERLELDRCRRASRDRRTRVAGARWRGMIDNHDAQYVHDAGAAT
jgi:hypothetical protein